MLEVLPAETEQLKRWLAPYTEQRILAGFLRAEDVPKVHPAAAFWPEDVADRVRTLHQASRHLSARPQAGRCRLFPIEEPEALDVLQNVSIAQPLGPGSPVSYSWVEIENLIATVAIADPMPIEVDFSGGAQALAQYSLLNAEPSFYSAPGGAVFSTSPVNVKLAGRAMQADRLILNYQLSLRPQLIVVGYQEGRFYLLSGYGRVLRALESKVDRVLCLIHYGLDLQAPNMGVRLLDNSVNHFGRDVLISENAPMVKDFLDPSLSVVFPAKGSFFMISPLVHVQQVQTTPPQQFLSPPTADKGDDNS